MEIIKTKYLPATNHRGERVKATTDNVGDKQASIIIDWDNTMTSQKNHINAARLLKRHLEWRGDWVGGHTSEGMVFVNKVIEIKL